MIQRKQTIFLVLACIAILACIAMPIGHTVAKAMMANVEYTNVGIKQMDGSLQNVFNPFICFLIISGSLSTWAIFDFKQRKRQARTCLLSMIMLLCWYAYFAFIYFVQIDRSIFVFDFAICLPFVAMVLLWLSRKAILADEALVRAADRIR